MGICRNGHHNPDLYQQCATCGVELNSRTIPPEPRLAYIQNSHGQGGPDPRLMPQRPASTRSTRRWAPGLQFTVIAAGGLLLAGALGLSVLVVQRNAALKNASSASAQTTPSSTLPASTLTDWQAAVCSASAPLIPHKQRLWHADDGAYCLSSAKPGQVLLFDVYTSEANVDLDLAMLSTGDNVKSNYATLIDTSGAHWLIVARLSNGDATAILPLDRFGFQFHETT